MSHYINIILRKLSVIFCFLLLPLPILSQQLNPHNNFNLQVELQKFVKQGSRIKEITHNIFQLTYPTGEKRIFNFNGTKDEVGHLVPMSSTIINVGDIDTTKYSCRFHFWQRINIVNDYEGIVPAEDFNNNGLLELYGFNEINSVYAGPVVIYEQNDQGIFHKVYTYDPNTIFVQGIGDVDSDGNKEIHLRTLDTLNGNFYKADSLSSLPTVFDFIFYYYPNQIQDEILRDIDADGVNNCIFIDGNNPSKVIISEFRDNINNFVSTFEMPIKGDIPSGFAIGDFDGDQKTEIVFGTVLQQVYIIEAGDNDQYSVTWQGLAPTYNAYMITSTDDIDKNGKPEFWVGGQDFDTGISTFWCYESNGDNSYIPVAEIQLRYLVTLGANYLQSEDMDNDGTEELIISLGNYLIILKFTGNPNQHQYEISYAKINELTQPGAQFHPGTIKDFNGDGKKDVLLPMERYLNPNIDLFSYLLVQDSVTSIKYKNTQVPDRFELMQNFPNPFNPSTRVKIKLGIQSRINISIFNLLGKEIKILAEETLSAGEHTFEWDGKDNEGISLPGGIYFIQLKAQSFRKTIKAVLLK